MMDEQSTNRLRAHLVRMLDQLESGTAEYETLLTVLRAINEQITLICGVPVFTEKIWHHEIEVGDDKVHRELIERFEGDPLKPHTRVYCWKLPGEVWLPEKFVEYDFSGENCDPFGRFRESGCYANTDEATVENLRKWMGPAIRFWLGAIDTVTFELPTPESGYLLGNLKPPISAATGQAKVVVEFLIRHRTDFISEADAIRLLEWDDPNNGRRAARKSVNAFFEKHEIPVHIAQKDLGLELRIGKKPKK